MFFFSNELNTKFKNKYKNDCVTFGCNSNYSNKKTIHLIRFAKEINRCLELMKNTLLKFLKGKYMEELNQNARLCDHHFENSKFQNEAKFKLKWNSVPSLFPNLSIQPYLKNNVGYCIHIFSI